jgi:hypothetical protein
MQGLSIMPTSFECDEDPTDSNVSNSVPAVDPFDDGSLVDDSGCPYSVDPSPSSESPEDSKLVDFANEKGLELVRPYGYKAEHEEFSTRKWDAPRKNAISRVKGILDRDKREMLTLFDDVARSASDIIVDLLKNSEDTDSGISGFEAVKSRITAKYLSLIGDRTRVLMLRARAKFGDRASFLEEQFDFVRRMGEEYVNVYLESENHTVDIQPERDAMERLFGVYRYRIEAKEETYRSRSFTAESLRQFLGYGTVEEMLIRCVQQGQNMPRSFVDFGCGDGDTLFQLKMAMSHYNERQRGVSEAVGAIRERVRKLLPHLNISSLLNGLGTPSSMPHKLDFDKIKPSLIGIDQAPEFLTRLSRSGIKGVCADISAPEQNFRNETKIRPGSVDVAISSFTLDRVYNPPQLLANISYTLCPNGQVVILTKSTIDPTSDGAGKAVAPISYGQKSNLRGRDRIELLEKLSRMMEEVGLKPVRIGRHPARIICTDCTTGPQCYDGLVIVARKTR